MSWSQRFRERWVEVRNYQKDKRLWFCDRLSSRRLLKAHGLHSNEYISIYQNDVLDLYRFYKGTDVIIINACSKKNTCEGHNRDFPRFVVKVASNT